LADDEGAEFPDTDCSALVPDDMFEQPDLNPGETAEGAYCAIAPIDKIPSMDIFVRPTGLDDDSTWWLTS
jgi:hypothetical protein